MKSGFSSCAQFRPGASEVVSLGSPWGALDVRSRTPGVHGWDPTSGRYLPLPFDEEPLPRFSEKNAS